MKEGGKKYQPIKIKNILSQSSNLKDRFIPNLSDLKSTVEQLKKMGYRIVLTQGVYDLLHEGHARYLELALSYGDILVVGVDSDELTRKRKGKNRPVVPQTERLQMLAHLRSVGILTLREVSHNLGKLIETVKPDVLITSESTKDFGKKETSQYRKFCGKIVTLPPQAITSTTARIRRVTIEGANQFLSVLMDSIPKLYRDVFQLDK